jgi:hypothetical protein
VVSLVLGYLNNLVIEMAFLVQVKLNQLFSHRLNYNSVPSSLFYIECDISVTSVNAAPLNVTWDSVR